MDEVVQERAALAAVMLVVILGFSVVGVVTEPGLMRWLYGAIAGVAGVGLVLDRCQWVLGSGVAAVVACLVIPYVGLWSEAATTSATAELIWLVLAVMIGGMVLAVPVLVGVLVVNQVVVAGLLLGNSGIPRSAAIEACALVLLVSALTWLSAAGRRRSQRRIAATIEERRRAETEARRASEAKTRFLANMSHELRTPMNVIVGFIDLLGDTDPSPRQVELMDRLGLSAEVLLGLIDKVLDFSSIEAGSLSLELVPCRPWLLAAEVIELLRARADERGLELELVVEAAAPGELVSDRARLRQVLSNLVSNALKFTDHGRVMVRVGAGVAADGALLARFEVHDTGAGIRSEDREHLFEPFVQAPEQRARWSGGVGLGLAISRRIVEALGGAIGVEPADGGGSCFWFTVPSVVVPMPSGKTAMARPGPSEADRTVRQGERSVLVVDDDEISREVAALQVRALGAAVEVAANGVEALEALASRGFDLVLMDCMMPVLDGFETTRRLRRLETDGRRTPVVALTAHAVAEEHQRCFDAGMDDVITKPVRRAQIREALERWAHSQTDASHEPDEELEHALDGGDAPP